MFAVGHGLPLALVDGEELDLVVPAALLLAHLLGDVGHVHQGVAIEPLLLDPGQVGAVLVLDHGDELGHRAAPRGLDLVLDLDARGLFVGRRHHVLEVHVEVLYIGALAGERDLDRLGLGVAGDEGTRRNPCGAGGGEFQEITTGGLRQCGLCHTFSPISRTFVQPGCHLGNIDAVRVRARCAAGFHAALKTSAPSGLPP